MSATILIVDDDPEVTAIFSRWLRCEGYMVRTAMNGEQALRELDGVDAIVLDFRMPILDGLGLLRRLRASASAVPVVMMTGDYLIDETVVAEFNQLNTELLFKPLWIEDLVSAIRRLLNHRAVDRTVSRVA